MMGINSFDDFQTQIQELYRQQEYSKALELALRIANRFPDEMPIVKYWQFCMAARAGKTDLSIQILSSTLSDGFWYSEPLLRKSPSLQPLQGIPDFERLVEQNRLQQLADQEHIFPVIVLRQKGSCQDLDHPCPLLIALHANASTAQASVDFWKPPASEGWLVAVPQSSQAMWKDAYMWDDMEIAVDEIQRHFAAIEGQYAMDAARVVIAGHSMGGEVAIRLALSGSLDVAGFIALGPGGPFMEKVDSWNELVEQARERQLTTGSHPIRGYILYGEEDQTISIESIHSFYEKLIQAGIPCNLESLSGVGHEYHPIYAPALLRALVFIENKP
jgi:predicted esterase